MSDYGTAEIAFANSLNSVQAERRMAEKVKSLEERVLALELEIAKLKRSDEPAR